jgi:hypothetical protein
MDEWKLFFLNNKINTDIKQFILDTEQEKQKLLKLEKHELLKQLLFESELIEKLKLCNDIKTIYTASENKEYKVIYMDDINNKLKSYNLPGIY